MICVCIQSACVLVQIKLDLSTLRARAVTSLSLALSLSLHTHTHIMRACVNACMCAWRKSSRSIQQRRRKHLSLRTECSVSRTRCSVSRTLSAKEEETHVSAKEEEASPPWKVGCVTYPFFEGLARRKVHKIWRESNKSEASYTFHSFVSFVRWPEAWRQLTSVWRQAWCDN